MIHGTYKRHIRSIRKLGLLAGGDKRTREHKGKHDAPRSHCHFTEEIVKDDCFHITGMPVQTEVYVACNPQVLIQVKHKITRSNEEHGQKTLLVYGDINPRHIMAMVEVDTGWDHINWQVIDNNMAAALNMEDVLMNRRELEKYRANKMKGIAHTMTHPEGESFTVPRPYWQKPWEETVRKERLVTSASSSQPPPSYAAPVRSDASSSGQTPAQRRLLEGALEQARMARMGLGLIRSAYSADGEPKGSKSDSCLVRAVRVRHPARPRTPSIRW